MKRWRDNKYLGWIRELLEEYWWLLPVFAIIGLIRLAVHLYPSLEPTITYIVLVAFVPYFLFFVLRDSRPR